MLLSPTLWLLATAMLAALPGHNFGAQALQGMSLLQLNGTSGGVWIKHNRKNSHLGRHAAAHGASFHIDLETDAKLLSSGLYSPEIPLVTEPTRAPLHLPKSSLVANTKPASNMYLGNDMAFLDKMKLSKASHEFVVKTLQEHQQKVKKDDDSEACFVIFFEEDNFEGIASVFGVGSYPHGARDFTDNALSSLLIFGSSNCIVSLYAQDHFHGWHVSFGPGEWNTSTATAAGFVDDDTTSFLITLVATITTTQTAVTLGSTKAGLTITTSHTHLWPTTVTWSSWTQTDTSTTDTSKTITYSTTTSTSRTFTSITSTTSTTTTSTTTTLTATTSTATTTTTTTRTATTKSTVTTATTLSTITETTLTKTTLTRTTLTKTTLTGTTITGTSLSGTKTTYTGTYTTYTTDTSGTTDTFTTYTGTYTTYTGTYTTHTDTYTTYTSTLTSMTITSRTMTLTGTTTTTLSKTSMTYTGTHTTTSSTITIPTKPRCNSLLYTGQVWGKSSRGLDLSDYTHGTLKWIGCMGNGCEPNSFYCNDVAGMGMEFGTTSESPLRALLGNAFPSTEQGCATASNPASISNAMDATSDVQQLCAQLGYDSGEIVEQVNENRCPTIHWDGMSWTSDFVASFGYGKQFRCRIAYQKAL